MADNTARQDQLRHDAPDDSVSAIGFPAGAIDIRNEFDAIVSQIRKILGSGDWRLAPTSDIITITTHLTNFNNPHATSLGNLGSGTLAQLNAVIVDATLDDITGMRNPNVHATSHQNGGVDEINVGGLSGTLADPQVPTTHAVSHQNGGGDELDLTGLSGLLATPQNPINHSIGHITGASDEVDGDRLNVNWSPTNYTPILVPETTSLDDLSSHLAGIDTAILAPIPGVHASTHENGGGDEISVVGLSGLLADPQTPAGHGASHLVGGSDPLQVQQLSSGVAAVDKMIKADGVGGWTLADDIYITLSNLTPTVVDLGGGSAGVSADGSRVDHEHELGAHGGSHGNGGVDEINVSGLSGVLVDPQVPTPHGPTHEFAGGDQISVAGLSGLLIDAQTPLAHAITHIRGAPDQIDGDIIDIDYVPVSYIRTTLPPQVTNVEELTAHLAGIDAAIGGGGLPAHANTHENGGTDEIDVTDLSGLLADAQTPLSHTASHVDGGSDELTVQNLGSGVAALDKVIKADGVGGWVLADDIGTPLSNVIPVVVTSGVGSAGVSTDASRGDHDHELGAHASTHENGGTDEISVVGLSGLLADSQTPLLHVSTHVNGGTDELSVVGLSGLLADPQTPLGHHSTHENGGVDEISVVGLSGLLADPQNPTTHASSHIRGGLDEIDGDVVDIDYTPTNYTPDITPPEVTNVDELSSHLAGIDNKLGEPTMVNITDNAVVEGNNSIIGFEDVVLVKRIRIETSSVNWSMILFSRDNYISDPLAVFEHRIGNWELEIDIPYEDKDASQEFHYSFTDHNGANTHDIEVWGVAL